MKLFLLLVAFIISFPPTLLAQTNTLYHNTLDLTPEEKRWLEEHPVLRRGYDVDWPPIERWTEKDGLTGLSADYLARIEERLGVRIEPVAPRDWKSMMDAARAGDVDIISAITLTPQREEFLGFTEPYLHFPMVIVTREDVPYISDMAELHGKKVGVVEGYASHDYISVNHPKVILLPSRNLREGLVSVINGETFAFVGSLATVSHVIAREGLGNLKISGETPYKYDLRIGGLKGEPLLLSAMQKALDAIPEEERSEIYRKWFKVTVEEKFDYRQLWRILAVFFLVVAAILLWNFLLKRTVARHTQELRLYGQILENMAEGVYLVKVEDLSIVYANSKFEGMFGYDPGELLGQHVGVINAPTDLDPKEIAIAIETELKATGSWNGDVLNRKKNGEQFWCHVNISSFDHQYFGKVWISIQQDVTERKNIENALYFTAQRGWGVTGESFFQPLVTYLAEKLNVEYAFIDRLSDDETATTVALHAGGKIAKNIEYPLRDTPCDNVMAKEMCIYPREIRRLFPHDKMLVEMNAESYIGLPLWDSRGEPIGLIAVMDTKPLTDTKLAEALLQVVAVRATAELERKRTEGSLRASMQLLDNVFESMQEGVLVLDADFKYTHFNRTLEEISRTQKEEVLGKIPWEKYPFLKGRVEEAIKNALRGGISRNIELKYTLSDGKEGWTTESYFPLKDSEENIVGVVGVVDDITERKQTEDELVRYRNRLEDLVESRTKALTETQNIARLGHWELNLKTDDLTWSEEVFRIFEIDKEKFGASYEAFIDAIHPDDREEVNEAYTSSLEDREPYEITHRLLMKDGRVKYVRELCRTEYGDDGTPLCSIGAVQDITALKVVEEELKNANTRLQELDRLKSMFIASMSHELRTPLNSIIGFTGILSMGLTGSLNPEQKKQLSLVKGSAAHLLDLVNEIIDISKIEGGVIELKITSFDLSEAVRAVTSSMEPAAKEKGLKVAIDIPEKLIVRTDKKRTNQVIVNLVGNAVKYSDEGEVLVSLVKKDETVELSVKDTGYGIKEEDKDKLFKAFSQIPIKAKVIEGTGLGLYISKKICDLIGGTIGFESEFGEGSTFTVTLPAEYKGGKNEESIGG